VIVAIVVPEIPRVVRLVRSVVLSIREEPYVEAAVALGTRTPLLPRRHVLPNTMAPLIVQATYIAASAILIEAILSFLGVGIPPQTPTWGNIMAEGRTVFRVYPHNILYPGIFLALTVPGRQHARRRIARRARPRMSEEAVTTPVLDVRDLTVTLPHGAERLHAVRDASLAVDRGEIVCLVGESGSGKSVIAHTTMGLLPKALVPAEEKSSSPARTCWPRARRGFASFAARAWR
jgi:ABC-type multidrug transport system fused ATPase/permease subunit